MFDYLLSTVENLINNYKILGLFVGMFLSSSLLPIPSEAILFYSGVAGISLIEIITIGSLGSSLGSLVSYYIGRGFRPFIDNYGKYLLVNRETIKSVEWWFKKWGNYGIIVARVIPFIPYKVFSIACGLGKVKCLNFLFFTFIGTIPRCLLLSYFGYLVSLTHNLFLVIISIITLFAAPIIFERLLKK
jgi:membrane protein DedA with SNARE-associated domain